MDRSLSYIACEDYTLTWHHCGFGTTSLLVATAGTIDSSSYLDELMVYNKSLVLKESEI